jgi:hypothetical protein
MHQQPLQAPFLPNKSSSAGHRSGVSGLTVSFRPDRLIPTDLFLIIFARPPRAPLESARFANCILRAKNKGAAIKPLRAFGDGRQFGPGERVAGGQNQ